MNQKIITISREFGSGGHKVGELLADVLMVPYYDKELLLLAAQRGGISAEKLEKYDEKLANYFLYETNYEGNEEALKGEPKEDVLYDLEKKTILEIGKSGSAVIVGRCADHILKEAGVDVLRIFVGAPMEFRLARTKAVEGFDEELALKIIKKKDKARKKYYEKHTGKTWGKPDSYDLYFDSSKYDNFNQIVAEIMEQL